MKKIGVFNYFLTRLIVILSLIVILVPLIWIISLSFRDSKQIFDSYLFFIPKKITFSPYIEAFTYLKKWIGVSFIRIIFNTFFVTIISLSISIIICSLSGFGFSNFKFKGKEFLYSIFLLCYSVPAQILVIPFFLMFKRMGILNTYFSVIIIYIVINMPIAILILRSFFEQIPKELKEAAVIDGASNFKYFISIILPLSKSAIATTVIFLFIHIWNEFLFALIFMNKTNLQTITVALSKISGGEYIIPWNLYAASIVITTIPVIIIFILFQKWFVKGVTLGAIKG